MTDVFHRISYTEAGQHETRKVLELFEASISILIDRHEDDRMSFDYSLRIMPGAYVSCERLSGVAATRQRTHVSRDGNDDLTLLIPCGGRPVRMHLSDRRHGQDEVFTRAGEPALLWGNDERFQAWALGCASQVVAVPRKDVSCAVGDLDRALSRGVPQTAALDLLSGYARTLASDLGPLDDRTLSQARRTLTDLFILALGPTRDAAEEAKGSARAARLARIKADIDSNLANPALSLDWIAGRHRISSRAIRDLFYAAGTNFTDHVLSARLARAHQLLSGSGLRNRNITSIAYECGFGDLSWFNQAFRRRYAMTPSDLRKQADRSRPNRPPP